MNVTHRKRCNGYLIYMSETDIISTDQCPNIRVLHNHCINHLFGEVRVVFLSPLDRKEYVITSKSGYKRFLDRIFIVQKKIGNEFKKKLLKIPFYDFPSEFIFDKKNTLLNFLFDIPKIIYELRSGNTLFQPRDFKLNPKGRGYVKLMKQSDIPKKCNVCGIATLLTIDHIIPKCLGGSNELQNLQYLCVDCHRNKDGNLKKSKIQKVFKKR